jgi:hypothetical protein
MFHTIASHLSYANTMSTLALFVALGGSSVAAVQLSRNSVRSEQIVNGQVKSPDLAKNAVTSVKVANGSLLAGDFKAGQLKAGPRGPQGPAGPKGDPGATNLKVRAATAAGGGEVTATCEPGERAAGGGAHSVNGAVVASAPAADPNAIHVSTGITFQGYAPTSWTAAAKDAMGNPTDVMAWVVCAAP